MSRIFFFLVALVAVALAVLLFLPGLIPVAAFKPQIEAQASAALGRDVTIGDKLSFRIFPRTAFQVDNLEVANAEGFDGDYLVRVEAADIGVKLIPLLSKSVEIDRFVLTRPDIRLARAKNGAVNWNLARTNDDAEASAETSSSGSLRELKLGDVRIVEGAAQFADAAAGKIYAASNIDLKVVLKSLAEPLEAKGTMVFQDAPASVDLVLTSLAEMMANEPSNLKLDLTIGDSSMGADLSIATKEGLRYSGPASLSAPDLPAFAALAGTPLADAPGFDNLSVKGNIDGGDTSMRLENADITFDEITAQGAITLNWAGVRPKASGVLSTDKLDLRPYMPPPAQSTEGFPAWSDAKMDFASLGNVDADFDISTNSIFINDLEFGESRIKLTIDAGRMTAEIPELSMYGGQGSGRMVVNARGATPSFAGNFDVGAVKAQPLSADLLKHDNLLGVGSFKLNFNATGASQSAIMSSIVGSGGFDLADGALKGVNIAALVRAVGEFQEGFNPAALQRAVAQARGPTEQTDFSEFLSDFSITNGLVNAPTITLNGPYLAMTGNGTINLAAQTIDLRLLPKGTSKMNGEGGKSITVPVRVGGTFSKPTIAIDAETLARTGLQRTLQNVLSGREKKEDGAEGAAEEEKDPARTLLEGILGGQQKKTDEQGDPNGGQEANTQSTEEVLINQGLNALFSKKKAAEEPAKEETPEQ
ncbi:AsmA family protein [Hyphococcus sp.]|uniref:AsmA family protein n=1 Tax=Hyphococcus sp. TaxID=2038636 RepID=UPI00208D3D4B|nr:MAG: cell envelope biogenesis protein AsmA [Marinicaulis sp.]